MEVKAESAHAQHNRDEVAPNAQSVDIEGLDRTEYRNEFSTATAETPDSRARSVSRFTHGCLQAHRHLQSIKPCVRGRLLPNWKAGESTGIVQLRLAPHGLSISSSSSAAPAEQSIHRVPYYDVQNQCPMVR